MAEEYHWLSSLTLQVYISPHEIRGPALLDLRWLYGSFSLACEASYTPLPSAPYWGVPGTVTTTTFLLTENI